MRSLGKEIQNEKHYENNIGSRRHPFVRDGHSWWLNALKYRSEHSASKL
jgi:hypothetical protein